MKRKIAVITFLILLALGFVFGIAVPLRAEKSDIEQRYLATFPKFSLENVIDGTFFSDISLWYSDSYPGREYMISAENRIQDLYGIDSDVMVVGTAMEADDIPDFDEAADVTDADENADNSQKTQKPATADANEYGETHDASTKAELAGDDSEEAINTDDVESEEDLINLLPEDSETPESTGMDAEIRKYVQQNLYVKDGAAYSAYYFSQKNATRYINALNRTAQELDGIANVYSILVPNQSGVMLSEEEQRGLGGSNQRQAIRYYYSQYDGVKAVETIDTLRAHNDEYLYFRTDHHETALGAYYMYRNFCAVKGIEPHNLSYFETMRFEPYLGSFYSTLQSEEMAANPDYVDAYIPHGTNDLVYWTVGGSKVEWNVVRDLSKWNKYSKYCCFIAGDKPLTIIENPEITDGSSCLVLKESYANCFVPFLVDHYQTVYVMDFRTAQHPVITYVKENGIDDLIIMNNITIAGGGSVPSKIDSLLQ